MGDAAAHGAVAPVIPHAIAHSAELWMRDWNIEFLLCELPGIKELGEGSHTVVAWGNDNIGGRAWVSTEDSLKCAGTALELLQLKYLAGIIKMERHSEGAYEHKELLYDIMKLWSR